MPVSKVEITKNRSSIIGTKGFTLVELMLGLIGVGILAFGLGSITQMTAKTMGTFKTATGSNGKISPNTLQAIQLRFLEHITSELSWRNTLKTAVPSTSPFACINNGTACGSVARTFDLYENTDPPTANMPIFYRGTAATSGFNAAGLPCVENAAATPPVICPIKYTLQWTPVCLNNDATVTTSTTPCTTGKEKILVTATLQQPILNLIEGEAGTTVPVKFNVQIFAKRPQTAPVGGRLETLPNTTPISISDFAINSAQKGAAVGILADGSVGVQCFDYSGSTKNVSGFTKINDSGAASGSAVSSYLALNPFVDAQRTGTNIGILYGQQVGAKANSYFQWINLTTCLSTLPRVDLGVSMDAPYKDLKIDDFGNAYVYVAGKDAGNILNRVFKKISSANLIVKDNTIVFTTSEPQTGIHIALNRTSGFGAISYQTQGGQVLLRRFNALGVFTDPAFANMTQYTPGVTTDSHLIELNNTNDFILLWTVPSPSANGGLWAKGIPDFFDYDQGQLYQYPKSPFPVQQFFTTDNSLFLGGHFNIPSMQDRSWILFGLFSPSTMSQPPGAVTNFRKYCRDATAKWSSNTFSDNLVSGKNGGYVIRTDANNPPNVFGFYPSAATQIQKNPNYTYTYAGPSGALSLFQAGIGSPMSCGEPRRIPIISATTSVINPNNVAATSVNDNFMGAKTMKLGKVFLDPTPKPYGYYHAQYNTSNSGCMFSIRGACMTGELVCNGPTERGINASGHMCEHNILSAAISNPQLTARFGAGSARNIYNMTVSGSNLGASGFNCQAYQNPTIGSGIFACGAPFDTLYKSQYGNDPKLFWDNTFFNTSGKNYYCCYDEP